MSETKKGIFFIVNNKFSGFVHIVYLIDLHLTTIKILIVLIVFYSSITESCYIEALYRY